MSEQRNSPENDAAAEIPECTAIVPFGVDAPNILFTPSCHCPRCAPEELFDHDAQAEAKRGWIRVSGRGQRLRIESVQLGVSGREMLG